MDTRQTIILSRFNDRSVQSLDELVEAVRVQHPTASRNSVNASVRLLSQKLLFKGKTIQLISGIGRGVKAVYQLKDIKELSHLSDGAE